MRSPIRWAIGAAVVLAAGVTSYWIITSAQQPQLVVIDSAKHPKLVVLFVFDQMRGDYPKKWQPLFGAGGFKRLQSEGAWFTNCHFPYAYTVTASGHTSLVTGASPSKHGIIGNEWYDRATSEFITATTPPLDEKRNGGGPYRRKSESVGDVLVRLLTGKSRVASISIKERAAVLLAALRAHLCYWFNSANGNFVTSAYYRPDPHSWVTKFNKTRAADQWLDKTWDRFHPQLDYARHSGPDDFFIEGTGYLQGQTFPHRFQYDEKAKDRSARVQNYYDAVTCSPMGNELLLMFAKEAIEKEKLGQSDSVDLLCVSFSSNDIVGHSWGPDSQEVLDITLRTDALIKDMLDFLDTNIGKSNYYFALSADHGVGPLPEWAQQQGIEAGRVPPELLTTQAEDFLNKKYLPEGKKEPWLLHPKRGNPWIYFNYPVLTALDLKHADVERALADWFTAQPGIEKAFTRTEMLREEDKEQTELFRQVQRSFHPDCSGDVMVVLKPYHLFSPPNLAKNPGKYPNYRASHGMPHAYDTHVPLMVIGPRIEPGTRDTRIAPQVMAAILAEALGVPAPGDAQYPTPAGLFKK